MFVDFLPSFFLNCYLVFSSDVMLQIKKEQTKGRTAQGNHTNTFECNTLLLTLRPYCFLANISLSESLFWVLAQPPSELHFSCSVEELI